MAAETGIAAVAFGIHNVAPTHGAATMVADADMVEIEGGEYRQEGPAAHEPVGHLLRLGIDGVALTLVKIVAEIGALGEFVEQDETGESGS